MSKKNVKAIKRVIEQAGMVLDQNGYAELEEDVFYDTLPDNVTREQHEAVRQHENDFSTAFTEHAIVQAEDFLNENPGVLQTTHRVGGDYATGLEVNLTRNQENPERINIMASRESVWQDFDEILNKVSDVRLKSTTASHTESNDDDIDDGVVNG